MRSISDGAPACDSRPASSAAGGDLGRDGAGPAGQGRARDGVRLDAAAQAHRPARDGRRTGVRRGVPDGGDRRRGAGSHPGHAEVAQQGESTGGRVLVEHAAQLLGDPRGAEVEDGCDGAGGGLGLGGEDEVEPRGVARRAHQPAGVLDERAGAHRPQQARGQVGRAAVRVDELAGARAPQAEGHRVHREVATREVVEEAPGTDGRQGARGRVGLGARAHEVEVASVRELDVGGPEARVRDDPGAEGPADPGGLGDGVTLDHEIELRAVGQARERVAHDAAHGAHVPGQDGCHPLDERMRRHDAARATRIHGVAYDPVSRKLAAVAPVANDLLERFERFEHLTLTELQEAFDAADARFKAWVETPGNESRPISEAPDYLDRIALDSLLERRTWSE